MCLARNSDRSLLNRTFTALLTSPKLDLPSISRVISHRTAGASNAEPRGLSVLTTKVSTIHREVAFVRRSRQIDNL